MPLVSQPFRISGPANVGVQNIVSLYADQGVDANYNGGELGTWHDQTPYDNDFVGPSTTSDNPFPLAAEMSTGNKNSIYWPSWASTWLVRRGGGQVVFNNGLSILICSKLNFTDSASAQAMNPPMTMVGHTSSTMLGFGCSNGALVYKYWNGSSIVTVSTPDLAINDGNLHTVAVTHSTSGAISLYVDSLFVASGTATYLTTTAINSLGAGYQNTDLAQEWNVGQIQMYNGVVSASQVTDFHNGTIAYWGPY